MAEEVAASAGKKVGMATLRTFSDPSINIVKTIPQGIIELSMRGAAVVLGFVALISAAASQGAVQVSSIILRDSGEVPASQTHAAGGWTIFISFWVMLYQALAIIQLFLHVKLAYKPVPVINWSYFFLVDIIAIGIAAGGYFCSAVSMAAYAARWAVHDGTRNRTEMATSSAGATSTFSFLALFLFIGMIVYFLLAKYVFLWPSHGDSAPAGGKSAASKAEDYAPEE